VRREWKSRHGDKERDGPISLKKRSIIKIIMRDLLASIRAGMSRTSKRENEGVGGGVTAAAWGKSLHRRLVPPSLLSIPLLLGV